MTEEFIDSRLKDGNYKKVAILVRDWLALHKGETFDLDMVCRHLELHERENRKYVAIELNRLTNQEKLEKVSISKGTLYRYIDNTIKKIDWVNASEENTVQLRWPCSHPTEDYEEETRFDFEDNVVVSPGDIIVIAGTSNMGKTALILNLLWDNMDTYPCTLMGNEYTPAKFKRRVSRMTWAEPLNGNGQPKFELIERREGWKDIIRPDNINLIDWINLGDNFYQIGMVIDGIQSKLREGIAVISLQKTEGKDRGLGGAFSEHLASIYITLDFEKLTIIKVKEWHGRNPNKLVYGFNIVDGGSKFHNIRRLKKCPTCAGYGKHKGIECDQCYGKGTVDN